MGLDSETDHLPVGEDRKRWAEAALIEKDREARGLEEVYAPEAMEAAKRLIKRFQTDA